MRRVLAAANQSFPSEHSGFQRSKGKINFSATFLNMPETLSPITFPRIHQLVDVF